VKVDVEKRQGAEPVEGKEDLTAQVLDWARDRAEALEGNSAPSETKPSEKPGTKTKGSARVVVVALHEGADNSGEAHLFDDLQTAGRFVETLVEDGLDQQRLTVFNCAQVDVQLTYRAVVHLKANEGQEEPAG
jgi:hypothetical protein